ncbi:hypothetical protein D3C80_1472630 [compost metagenome]
MRFISCCARTEFPPWGPQRQSWITCSVLSGGRSLAIRGDSAASLKTPRADLYRRAMFLSLRGICPICGCTLTLSVIVKPMCRDGPWLFNFEVWMLPLSHSGVWSWMRLADLASRTSPDQSGTLSFPLWRNNIVHFKLCTYECTYLAG